jgi:hypothetical protein
MLLQANFENTFHTAPAAFIIAVILGRISRELWTPQSADEPVPADSGTNRISPDRRFLLDVRTHVGDFLAGRPDAISKLISHISQSKKEQWKRSSLRIAYWSKSGNDESLRQAVINLETKASEELANLAGEISDPDHPPNGGHPGWRIARNLALAGYAAFVLITGATTSRALVHAWEPMYHPERLAFFDRFTRLLNVVERHPGLGIDRKVLTAGLDALYHYQSQEAREYFAITYRPRILRSVPGWRTDPGAALQLADISGWAGDPESALGYYNHAIAAQGNNELLFMARSFKGQYLYELCVSAAAAGELEQLRFHAAEAVASLKEADAAMALNRCSLSPFFAKMLQECEKFQKQDM